MRPPRLLLPFALLLAAGLQAQPAPLPRSPPISRPPDIRQVLESDSVTVLGSGALWHMQYVSVRGEREVWVVLSDSYGGEVYIPASTFLAVGSDLEAFMRDEEERSVLLLSRPFLATAMGVIAVGLLSLIVAPVVLLRRNLRRESARRVLGEQVRGRLTESQEAERVRIARDLHDGPIQDLYALQMQLNVLALEPPPGPAAPLVQERLSTAAESAGYVIACLRAVSENLRPPALEPFGLVAALNAFVKRFEQLHPGIGVRFEAEGGEPELEDAERLALFRIAQEAVNNASRHAAPTRIELCLHRNDAALTLRISDDGCGFDVPVPLQALAESRHYGLLGMAERASQIDATLRISSTPAVGTTVEVALPSGRVSR